MPIRNLKRLIRNREYLIRNLKRLIRNCECLIRNLKRLISSLKWLEWLKRAILFLHLRYHKYPRCAELKPSSSMRRAAFLLLLRQKMLLSRELWRLEEHP